MRYEIEKCASEQQLRLQRPKERELNMETLEIHIEASVESYKKLVELVKVIREIQKEHRCNCTLSVEIGH